MYTFGGVYLDMDGECIRSAGAFFDGLPPGSTAWSGGYPEPFFMASTPGNPFWLSFVGSVFESWRHKHVRNSSGPQGLQAGLVKWANGNGGPEAVRKFSMSNEKECSIIRPPGDVAHNVATWRWITEPHQLAPGTPPPHEHRIGFIPNQVSCVPQAKVDGRRIDLRN